MRGGSTLAATGCIALSAVLWGTLWIPLRRLDELGLGQPLAKAAALLLPLLLLLPLARRRRASGPGWGWRVPAGGLCLAASIALYAEGLVRGQVARVVLLFYLTPVWSALLGRLAFGEPITARRLGTLLLGLTGLLAIFGEGGGARPPAAVPDWMGLFAGVAWALAMAQLHRGAALPGSASVLAPFLFLGPLLWLLAILPGASAPHGPPPAQLAGGAVWWVALGLVWMLPVVALTVYGARRLDPARVAICLMLEIVVGLGSAALLAGEPFGPRQALGAVLILAANGAELAPLGPRTRGPA